MLKPDTHVPTEKFMNPLTTGSIFASYSVCTTEAWFTTRWVKKFVDEAGSTFFYNNIVWVFATSRAITKADRPLNLTIFHCRMSTIQPAWPVCTTFECWHTRCWHFFFLQLPQKDTIPQRVGSHTTLNRKVYCNLSLYWLHSGFYNHSKDRLQSEMTIAKGLKLLKSIFQEFL